MLGRTHGSPAFDPTMPTDAITADTGLGFDPPTREELERIPTEDDLVASRPAVEARHAAEVELMRRMRLDPGRCSVSHAGVLVEWDQPTTVATRRRTRTLPDFTKLAFLVA